MGCFVTRLKKKGFCSNPNQTTTFICLNKFIQFGNFAFKLCIAIPRHKLLKILFYVM